MTAHPKHSFHAVAPVSAVCAAFAAQPSVYPPEARRPDVAPPCGSVAKAASAEEKPPAGGFRQRVKPQAAKQEKKLLVCIVNRHQIVQFQQILARFPGSFSYVSEVTETMGNFKKIRH